MELTIKLSLEDITVILTALSQGPYNQVAGVIGSIESQAKEQLPSPEDEQASDSIEKA